MATKKRKKPAPEPEQTVGKCTHLHARALYIKTRKGSPSKHGRIVKVGWICDCGEGMFDWDGDTYSNQAV